MKNRQVIFSLVIVMGLTIVFPGCKTTGLTKVQQCKQFKKMTWLLGDWQNIGSDMSLIENWTRVLDTIYRAKSTFLFSKDTLYTEELKLAPSGKNIYLYVTSHNSGKTIKSSYVLKKNNGSELVFEDPSNKEQSRITYEKKSADIIILKVEGLDGTKVTTEAYKLVRNKSFF